MRAWAWAATRRHPVYLTSDASAYHSGDTFVIDGGYLIF